MSFRTFILATTLVTGVAASATAATLTEPTASFGLATTNWTSTLSVPQFNPALGTLTSVTYTFNGSILGNIKIESQDNAPATITATLMSMVKLTLADGTTLTATPSAQKIFSATKYDGTLDFGGTSGATYTGLAGSTTFGPTTLTSASQLALYTGTGTLSLAASATGASSATGAGNIVSSFMTTARAQLDVTYTYTPTTTTGAPEPAALAVVGAGLFMLGLVRRATR